MPNNNTKISDMSPAEELNTTDLLMISQQDAEVETEFHTKNTTIGDLADEVVNGIQFTNDLNTDDKTIVGAINEAAAVGKISEFFHRETFSANSYNSWVDSGTAVDGHTVYQSHGRTYEELEGDSLCTWTIEGCDDVTFHIKQDGSDTSRAYTVLGKANTSIDLEDDSSYAVSYKDDVLNDYASYKFENLNGATKTFQVLYHTDPTEPTGTATVDLTDSQFVDTGTTIDGHTVYMSNAASKCRINLQGVSSFKIYYKAATSDYQNRIYIGELDTSVSTSDYDTRSSEDERYYYTSFTCSKNENHYVEIMFNKIYSYLTDDSVYFYVVLNGDPHTTRGYVYITPGQIHTSNNRGEVFNDYDHNFATGLNSHAEGSYTLANGEKSHAEGYYATASGSNSHAEGDSTQATGSSSHAEGGETSAQGTDSHAEGHSTIAVGSHSHAEGYGTQANNVQAHAEGYESQANAPKAHAEGMRTKANTEAAHSEGFETICVGTGAHAEGYSTYTYAQGAHAEGYGTKAYGNNSHAEGKNTSAGSETSMYNSSEAAHAEGMRSQAIDWGSHAEGTDSLARGVGAHAEGRYTQSTQEATHAEGYSTSATGYGSHSEGRFTTASNGAAHSEGLYSVASGESAHAEGYYTEASGVGAHAEGNGYDSNTKNIASGSGSHAEGYATRATGNNSHAEGGGWGGQYNIASGIASHAEGGGNNAIGPCSHVEGTRNTVYSESGHADGSGNIVYGYEAHGEGAGTITAGEQGHSEGAGNTNVADKGHIEGGGNRNTYNASLSHTEGAGNTNYGIQGHVEGAGNTLSGEESHVEGAGNRVHGPKSHGEGGGNVTYGLGSHIEGKHNVAVGYGQHAEGINNVIGVTEEPDYFSYGTTYAVDDIVAVNDLYRDNYSYSGALEPTTPFLFKCITAPGQIQETTGVQIVTASEWSSSTTYQAGSVVKVSGVGLYTNPSENTGKHPAIKSNGWNRISAILSPFSSHTPSSKTYYLLDCDDGINSSKVAIVDANTTVAAMWEPVTTPTGSHIEGLGNISTGDHQHVQGKFNTPDAQKAFIIGNGSVTEGTITRSNAMTVDWYGNMVLAGDVTVGAINDTISGLAARIPAAPTTDGTYVLSVTVSSGVPTYSWVASS